MNKNFKIKIKGPAHKHKLSFFCSHCKKITGTLDDEYLQSLGICAECVVMYVEEREKPVIDLSEYAPPGGIFENMTRSEIDSYFRNSEK